MEITCEPFMGPARTVNAASSDPESYIWNGLAGGETYTFTLKAVDDSGNRSAPVSITGTPYDTTPPAPVPNLTISPGDGCAVLTWTDPADADLQWIQIECYDSGGSPVGPSTGEMIAGGTGTWTLNGLTNGEIYTFTVKTVDINSNRSGGISPSAWGGNVAIRTIDGTVYEIHTFTNTGTDTLKFYSPAATPAAVDVLIVAGGGGAGGLLYKTGQTLTLTDNSVTVTVGAGGAGGAISAQGLNGEDSSIRAVTVPGGGGGAGSAGKNTSGNTGGAGGDGWKPSENGAAWMADLTGTAEFSHGGRGASRADNMGAGDGPGAHYGDGGSGNNSWSVAMVGTAGHSGIVIVRWPYIY